MKPKFENGTFVRRIGNNNYGLGKVIESWRGSVFLPWIYLVWYETDIVKEVEESNLRFVGKRDL